MAERTIGGLPLRVAMLYVVLGLASLAAYGILWPDAPAIDGDSSQYMEVARDLRDFHIDEIHDRAPGYPALLALTGSGDAPTRSLFRASLLLHFGSVWLLALALHATGASTRALTAFGILLTLPPYVEPAGYVMTENLAQFTLAAGLTGLVMWLAYRRRAWLVAASLAFAVAGLTRPTYQLLAIAIAATLVLLPSLGRRLGLVFRDALTGAIVLALGSIVILGGLCWRNQVTFGYFGVAPTFGLHLSTKTMSFVERLPDEYSVAREILVRERNVLLTRPGGTHDGTQTIWHAREELSKALGLSTPELSKYLVKMNLRLIAQAPLEYLDEVGRAYAAYWFPASGPLAAMNSPILRWSWVLLHLIVLAVFFVQLTVAVGITALEMTRTTSGVVLSVLSLPVAAYLLAGGIFLYTLLLSCFLDIGEPRQRRPTDVLIVFMCVLGVYLWRSRLVTTGDDR
jgi:4-amino-4-deoxy-L-arabinose transferase-like glycosyltransferase